MSITIPRPRVSAERFTVGRQGSRVTLGLSVGLVAALLTCGVLGAQLNNANGQAGRVSVEMTSAVSQSTTAQTQAATLQQQLNAAQAEVLSLTTAQGITRAQLFEASGKLGQAQAQAQAQTSQVTAQLRMSTSQTAALETKLTGIEQKAAAALNQVSQDKAAIIQATGALTTASAVLVKFDTASADLAACVGGLTKAYALLMAGDATDGNAQFDAVAPTCKQGIAELAAIHGQTIAGS